MKAYLGILGCIATGVSAYGVVDRLTTRELMASIAIGVFFALLVCVGLLLLVLRRPATQHDAPVTSAYPYQPAMQQPTVIMMPMPGMYPGFQMAGPQGQQVMTQPPSFTIGDVEPKALPGRAA